MEMRSGWHLSKKTFARANQFEIKPEGASYPIKRELGFSIALLLKTHFFNLPSAVILPSLL